MKNFSACGSLSVLLLLAAACGDDTAPADGGSDTGVAVDSATDSSTSDAAVDCTSAVEDAACTVDGATCSDGCTDVCSFCNILRCEGGVWTALEASPAPCFDCGSDLACQSNVDYCSHTIGGPAGSTDTFECTPAPTDCVGDLTCACLSTAGVSGDCAEPEAGEVTVTLALP